MKPTTLLILLASVVMAAAATNEITATDETIRDTLGKYSMVKLFITPLVVVIVMAVRKWIGLIPDQMWPWLAPFIGVGLDYLADMMGFWTGSIQAGAAMGGLAVWFHQLSTQTKEMVQEGPLVTEAGKSNEPTKPTETTKPKV